MDDKLEKVLAVIDQKTMWKGVSNESEIKKQLHSKLSKVLDSKKVLKDDAKNLFNFSPLESTTILNLLDVDIPNYMSGDIINLN